MIPSRKSAVVSEAVIVVATTRATTVWSMSEKRPGRKITHAMKVLTTVDTLLKVSSQEWELQSYFDITETRKAERPPVLLVVSAKTSVLVSSEPLEQR